MAGNTYNLIEGYHVEDGGKLIIEEGVTIVATRSSGNPDYILIEQGGKIEANGTKDKPIVMTSSEQKAGHGVACTYVVELL